MIQRKQTLYLLAAAIIGLLHLLAWTLFAIQLLASIVCLYTIFKYKQRKRQAALCLVAVGLNIVWYLVLAVLIQQGMLPEAIPYVACLPLVAAILCFLARKGVIDDEKVVKVVKDGLVRKHGFCPCRLPKLPEFFCPCDEFKGQLADPAYHGLCHCRLYLKP